MKVHFDMRDVALGATAEIEEILREVMEDLTMPQMVMQVRQMWADMPDEMKEKFAEERPEEYRALMELLDG